MIQKLYIGTVAGAGIALLVYTLPDVPAGTLLAVLMLAALCAAAQRMPVSLFASSSISVSVAFAFAGVLLFGPAAAILINLPSMLVHAVYPMRRPVHKTLFNLGLVSVAAGVSGLLYRASGGEVPIENYPGSILPMGVAALAYFLIQSVGVTIAIRLSQGGSLLKIWDSNYRWLSVNYLAMAGVSMGMALAYRTAGPLGLAPFSLPLVMAWYSFRLYMSKSKEVRKQNALLHDTNSQLEESFRSTIRALAAAADTKDHYTQDHSELAMRYAAETAQRMGLNMEATAAVQVAALFHDIGKIGIPDAVLRKEAALDFDEWQVMRQHPALGAKVIEQIATLKEVVPAILHHHERYDGTGYPGQLRGGEIPLIAQIVSVVDAYQAMTSDRPYRKALLHEQAVCELREHAGTQFNPDIVDAFLEAQAVESRDVKTTCPVDLSLLLQRREPVMLGVSAQHPNERGDKTDPRRVEGRRRTFDVFLRGRVWPQRVLPRHQ